MDVNCRQRELDELGVFIDNQEKSLQSVLHSLGWSKESLDKEVSIFPPLYLNLEFLFLHLISCTFL